MTTDLPPTGSDPDGPETAHEQRGLVARPNRNLALILIGGALLMLAAAFTVAILIVYGA
ncbi:MAG: hypothetical protein KGI94_01795 [Paracoccaceae bacterium]|nr:hypothetical protein [Paracoccaceae bacterium]MDE3120858.1 hypothetical protein [Paracoccaceae bacterium]MDE3240385.1 hypothetical protein [Paracoccaceae bacterium]